MEKDKYDFRVAHPLEEAWLEAQKEARLIVERREQVLAQLLELAPLLVVMGVVSFTSRFRLRRTGISWNGASTTRR